MAFIEECMALGLGISRGVNKLSALLAAAKFVNPSSPSIHRVEERRRRCQQKRLHCTKEKELPLHQIWSSKTKKESS